MIILALDLGTNLGVAVGHASDKPRCYEENLGESGGGHGPRFSHALQFGRRMIVDHQPDLIALEMPVAAGPKGGQERIFMAAGLRGIMIGMAHYRRVRTVEYAVSTIRKHFLGNGKLSGRKAKAATMQECLDRGWEVAGFDQSDAAALWDLARAKEGFESPSGLFARAAE